MSIPAIILALVGGVLGAAVGQEAGFLFGLVAGYSLGAIIHLSGRIRQLEQRIGELGIQQAKPEPPPAPLQEPVAPPQETAAPAASQPEPQKEPIESESATPLLQHARLPERLTKQTPPPARTNIPQEDFMDKVQAYIYGFFTDGNVVVKVGVLVLFTGVGFLLKYAAEHSMIPMPLRIAGIGLGGIILSVIGWRLRAKRRIYALLLQGGGVGVMYLTVFAAAKLYHLLPVGLSLVLMIALVVLSGILAVLQDAKYLAFYGAAGGFLAPVLASTGAGSHVMLFSYYALLNLGILGIAWYRSWRELNLLGFAFTFVIGMLWGAQYYRPVYFATVAIAILFAFRQPPQLKGYIDSTLVFGVPVVAFALQAALVRDMYYGLAISALVISAFYIILAKLLWSRSEPGMRLLTEAFLAMGVVFGSLAIPLALDGRWTSVAWALEGAAIVWVGVRQQRILARIFGLLLQFGSGVFFLQALHLHHTNLPVLNGVFVGAVIVSIAGLFSSFYFYRHTQRLRDWERDLHIPLLVWGICWWLGAGINEIRDFIGPHQLELNLILAYVTSSLLLAHYLQYKLRWQVLRFPVLAQLYAMLLALALVFVFQFSHPMAWHGWLTWLYAFAAFYWFMFRYRNSVLPEVLRWQHVMAFWLLVLLLSWESAWLARTWIQGHTWHDIMIILIPAMMVLLLMTVARRLKWPVEAYYEWYLGFACMPIILGMALFALVMGLFHDGNPLPLDYLPFVNPLDLSVGLVLYVLILWRRQVKQHLAKLDQFLGKGAYRFGLAVGAFLWLNGIIARSVHYWFGVPHTALALEHSTIFQASISVTWTITALFVMWLASRRRQRESWFVGLGLFLTTVAKLFLVDIADKNELTMIISLIMIAILAIVFGYYLLPLPPRRKEKTS
ncbi:MAG: DUF2339 domain-containing protein [Gammaproteobacteria bacterium]